jgi:peptidoglycan/LPS O-acetylase OafA/YrhL
MVKSEPFDEEAAALLPFNDLDAIHVAESTTSGRHPSSSHILVSWKSQSPWKLISSTWSKVVHPLLVALLPSFIGNRIRPKPHSNQASRKEIHPTAWLDGLRGFAALFVFFAHLQNPFHNQFDEPYNPGTEHVWLVQLPIIRLIFSGSAMVSVFYVVSGFSLSYNPVRLMRARSYDRLLPALASSTFRRFLRLFMPTVAVTFITMIAVMLGLYRNSIEVDKNLQGPRDSLPPHGFENIRSQLWNWWECTFRYLMLWSWDHATHPYDPHLWTIRVEYRCSLVLYLTQLGLHRCRPSIRMVVAASLMVFSLETGAWEMFLFLWGMVLAEIHHIRTERVSIEEKGSLSLAEDVYAATGALLPRSVASLAPYVGCFILFLFALAVLSTPVLNNTNVIPYSWWTNLIPLNWYPFETDAGSFWRDAGAALLILSITLSPPGFLPRIFNNALARYLGNISFALYLIHGPYTVQLVGYNVIPPIQDFVRRQVGGENGGWGLGGSEGVFSWCLGFLMGAAFVVVPIAIWIADLVWRGIDLQSVRFAKWLDRVCSDV